ncbi:hypothetical protein Tco_1193979 [Tanacetum coccineum]
MVIVMTSYTWTHFLRSMDETPEVLINFLRMIQRGIQAQVRSVRTDRVEPKNIKEAMVDHAWIEAMQKDLHQFE